MSKKLTPWFPGYVKPERAGVYEVRSHVVKYGCYAWFDGEGWAWSHGSRRGADEDRSVIGAFQDKEWRGLAKKP